MPICNKCKMHSNCLTIDQCEHCGAKDWDESTVLTFSGKPKGQSSTKTYGEKLGDELFGSPLKDYARIPSPRVSLFSEISGALDDVRKQLVTADRKIDLTQTSR